MTLYKGVAIMSILSAKTTVARVAVWSDYTWCYEEDLESYTHMSDDYMLIDIPDSVEDIDVWLDETRPQD